MYMNHASRMPAATTIIDSTSSMMPAAPLCSASCRGSTGDRKRAKGVPCSNGIPTAAPATRVSAASTISGHVITRGDSCAWCATSLDMRGPVKKARKTSRNV